MWAPGGRQGPALLALLLAAACYRPDLPGGRFKCDGADPVCPEGQQCLGGLCRLPGEVDLLPAPEPDLSAAADLSAPDLRVSAPPDLASGAADLASAPCAQGGQQIAPEVYACKGAFTAPAAGSLCGSGYALCTDEDEARYAATYLGKKGVDNCVAIGGFYAIRATATIKSNGDGRCGEPNSGETAALPGCGTEDGTLSPGQSCKSLKSFFPCGVTKDWSCSGGLDTATHRNLDGKGGVLCCKQ